MARRGVGIGATASPNATIIGFVRGPVEKAAQRRTQFQDFGFEDKRGQLGKYSIEESIQDYPRRRTFWRVAVAAPVGFYDARKRSRDGAARVAHTPSTVSASAPNSTGLMRMASNPAADGETLHSSKALAVRAIMGVGDQPQEASSLRKRRVAS